MSTWLVHGRVWIKSRQPDPKSRYRVSHRFGQAKFAYGGQVLGSSRFLLLPQLPEKKLASIVVKIDSKIIISRHESKSVTHSVPYGFSSSFFSSSGQLAMWAYQFWGCIGTVLELFESFGQQYFSWPRYVVNHSCPVSVKLKWNIQYGALCLSSIGLCSDSRYRFVSSKFQEKSAKLDWPCH